MSRGDAKGRRRRRRRRRGGGQGVRWGTARGIRQPDRFFSTQRPGHCSYHTPNQALSLPIPHQGAGSVLQVLRRRLVVETRARVSRLPGIAEARAKQHRPRARRSAHRPGGNASGGSRTSPAADTSNPEPLEAIYCFHASDSHRWTQAVSTAIDARSRAELGRGRSRAYPRQEGLSHHHPCRHTPCFPVNIAGGRPPPTPDYRHGPS